MRVFVATGSPPQPTGIDATHRLQHGTYSPSISHTAPVARLCAASRPYPSPATALPRTRTRRPRPPCLAPAPVARDRAASLPHPSPATALPRARTSRPHLSRDRAAFRPHSLRNFHSASWARVLWLSLYLCKKLDPRTQSTW